jgi:light-independent protochlorophyllide reductase subunit B
MRLALWMYEGTAHHGVGRITNSMRGVHAVFHAPQGDDYVVPIFSMLERAANLPQMSTSVVSGRDLAQGTIRLPETLRQVDTVHQPDLIVVCASCSTILLQEDLVVTAASAKTRAGVLVYDANPYRMQEIDAAEGLFTLLVKQTARPQALTTTPSVNILGPASLGFHARSDLIALRRMLQTLGIQINVIAPLGASLADLERLPAAWVTIAPYRELGMQAANYLEAQFGTPALLDAPIGVQPTLRWLNTLLDLLNTVGRSQVNLKLPALSAFSLDGLSAPSGVPWFARTADMESFSTKKAFVFGDATHTVGMARFLYDELGMQLAGVGTYLPKQAAWVREQLAGYPGIGELLVTDRFQEVTSRIEELMPDLVCGTQMERHSCRKLDRPCLVIAPPTHIENHLLAYRPVFGFDGADVLADEVYTTATLGMEKHLIDLFGDAGLEYDEKPTTSEPPVSVDVSQPVVPVAEQPLSWSADAQALLKKIPFFVRGKAQKNIERYAQEHGIQTITNDIVHAAREAVGG